MSRKQVDRSLPRLSKLFPRFRGFASTENNSRRLLDALRATANKVRRKKPHPFYSMREAGAFFQVSPPLVARAYQKLEQEGLLLRIRGSMTLVQPRRMRPRIPVRAVVGLPVWLTGFTRLCDWRLFLIRLEEFLRRHHFVVDFVFFGQHHNLSPSYTDRLLAHQLDYLIWFSPPPQVVPILQTAGDYGVQTIVVSTTAFRFPGRQYSLSWERAISDGLADWKRSGITEIIIPRNPNTGHTEVEGFRNALNRSGMAHSMLEPKYADPDAFVSRLMKESGKAIIFEDDLLCMELCHRSPQAMQTLFKTSRVMVTRSVNFPESFPSDLCVDVAHVDWQRVGRRIADDLAKRKPFDSAHPVIFEAKWSPRALMSQFEEHSQF